MIDQIGAGQLHQLGRLKRGPATPSSPGSRRVGSVGTLDFMVLLQGRDQDLLFLQVKEATASVLEDHAAYLGKGDHFDPAVTAFAKRYTDQNERNY